MTPWFKWLALAGLVGSAVFTSSAYAQATAQTGVSLSPEFWAGALLTIALALVTGYARGIDKRVSMIEYDNRNLQSQISGLREMVKGEYHPKGEVHAQLDEIKELIGRLNSRMDYFAGGQAGRPFPERT